MIVIYQCLLLKFDNPNFPILFSLVLFGQLLYEFFVLLGQDLFLRYNSRLCSFIVQVSFILAIFKFFVYLNDPIQTFLFLFGSF